MWQAMRPNLRPTTTRRKFAALFAALRSIMQGDTLRLILIGLVLVVMQILCGILMFYRPAPQCQLWETCVRASW
jgi:hypothetical protein